MATIGLISLVTNQRISNNLTKAAPKKAVKSYRFFYARYYCTNSGRFMLGEYEDVDGKIYIVDIHGNVLKKGRVNRKIFTGDIFFNTLIRGRKRCLVKQRTKGLYKAGILQN